MRVVGGVPIWVVCVFPHVDVISSLLMFVSDASGDHMVETYSSMSLVMAFMLQ